MKKATPFVLNQPPNNIRLETGVEQGGQVGEPQRKTNWQLIPADQQMVNLLKEIKEILLRIEQKTK